MTTDRLRKHRGKTLLLRAFLGLLAIAAACPRAQAGVSVIGGLTRETTVEPGKTYQGTILLQNGSDSLETVKAYQTDYLFFSDGKTIYGPPGEDDRSNAGWITFAPSRVEVLPGGSASLHYTINVPDDKEMLGTYWSMLMVEIIPKDSPEASVTEDVRPAVGVSQVIRYGIQMVTNIGATGTREVVLEARLVRESGKRLLQAEVENTGQRWLRPFVWAELYDENGRNMGRLEGNRIRVYPGTAATSTIDLSDLPEGTYKALVVADGGGDDVFGATYTLKLENPGSPET